MILCFSILFQCPPHFPDQLLPTFAGATDGRLPDAQSFAHLRAVHLQIAHSPIGGHAVGLDACRLLARFGDILGGELSQVLEKSVPIRVIPKYISPLDPPCR